MTLNKIFTKLQKYNIKNYRQLKFCIAFAVTLLASFITMVLNPAIQGVLPAGGDSRKQVYLIFAIAVVGCFVFIIYAVRLFLRYRSREIGVFLALGAEKRQLSKALYVELAKIGTVCSFAGILSGAVLAYLVLTVLRVLFPFGMGEPALVPVGGLAASVLCSVLVLICMMILAVRFMKRTDIIDILNEQRTNEPVRQDMSRGYLIVGIACLVLGLLVTVVAVPAYARATKHIPGVWVNLFYLVALFGLYRVLIYSIAVHKRGKHPQKYYKNLISYGLLKFQGRSVVWNMLIVCLLIVCSLFACLYSPGKYLQQRAGIDKNPADYAMSYPLSAGEPDRAEIENLAKQYGVSVTDYREGVFIRLLGSGVNRDDVDDSGKLIELYEKEYYYYSFIDETAFRAVTGGNLSVDDGTYYMIRSSSMYENLYNQYDDLDYVQNIYTGAKKNLTYAGTVEYNSLVMGTGFDGRARYVISDADYAELKRQLPDQMIVKSVLFNVADLEASDAFARALYREFCIRASSDMLKMYGYDEHREETALQTKGYYGYADPVMPDPEHSEEYCDWKYMPSFKILEINNAFISFGVFYMLFIYVAVICLASVAVISYTRSMTVAVRNKQVFEDVRRLGGDRDYIRRILSDQVRRVYVLPTVIGCLIMLVWYPLLMWQNDGRFTPAEFWAILVEIVLCALIALYQYAVYKVSMRQGEKVVMTDDFNSDLR